MHVAAGILIDSVGRLLITDRSRAKSMRGFWEFPGGKLASGESAEDALRRELAEELEIEIVSFEYFCSLGHDYPGMRVAIDFFLVRQWQGTPSGIEGQALQWLRPSEFSPGLLLPADAPLLDLLQNL
ncbi:MAG: 8-oxo-dGTP diphosphatase MutT [Proteobacteria bacterium]|nr:8-oxo-dGTP diphosphatase MutT [Pseudomonadota bacterium]